MVKGDFFSFLFPCPQSPCQLEILFLDHRDVFPPEGVRLVGRSNDRLD
jgi:hypothetical protein